MRLLTVTTLYPRPGRPGHGRFVENRLVELVAREGASVRVVAPVAFDALRGRPAPAEHAALAERAGRPEAIEVLHPRFATLPGIAKLPLPWLIASSCLGALREAGWTASDIDLVDGHYFWPDGAAAALVARALDRPLAITARGSDINVFPGRPGPRLWIRWAIRRADAIVTVSEALRERTLALGADPARTVTISNGVDLERFRPADDRDALRARLGWRGPTLLSVGNLVELKGHDLVIRALGRVPDASLVIVGQGPERERLEALARRTGVAGRVSFTGTLTPHEVGERHRGADALVLASSREGYANVLLESIACGTPVVATRVGGNPEIVDTDDVGRLTERDPEAIAATVRALLDDPPRRELVRERASRHGWGPICRRLHDVLAAAAATRP